MMGYGGRCRCIPLLYRRCGQRCTVSLPAIARTQLRVNKRSSVAAAAAASNSIRPPPFKLIFFLFYFPLMCQSQTSLLANFVLLLFNYSLINKINDSKIKLIRESNGSVSRHHENRLNGNETRAINFVLCVQHTLRDDAAEFTN